MNTFCYIAIVFNFQHWKVPELDKNYFPVHAFSVLGISCGKKCYPKAFVLQKSTLLLWVFLKLQSHLIKKTLNITTRYSNCLVFDRFWVFFLHARVHQIQPKALYLPATQPRHFYFTFLSAYPTHTSKITHNTSFVKLYKSIIVFHTYCVRLIPRL